MQGSRASSGRRVPFRRASRNCRRKPCALRGSRRSGGLCACISPWPGSGRRISRAFRSSAWKTKFAGRRNSPRSRSWRRIFRLPGRITRFWKKYRYNSVHGHPNRTEHASGSEPAGGSRQGLGDELDPPPVHRDRHLSCRGSMVGRDPGHFSLAQGFRPVRRLFAVDLVAAVHQKNMARPERWTIKSMPEKKRRAAAVLRGLGKLFPDPKIALNYRTPWELLVAVILSAQCTDKKVNEVTPALFRKHRNFGDVVSASPSRRTVEEFEKCVKSCGFYRAKTRSILGAARAVKERFGGKLPRTMAEMVGIPGLGRKYCPARSHDHLKHPLGRFFASPRFSAPARTKSRSQRP